MDISNIDENRQSRSIATFGIENIKKFSKLKIFIYGVSGIGLEAAKNLILTGIKSLTIYDDTISRTEDLSWNFFLDEEDIGKKRRDEAVLEKLKDLNEYVEIIVEKNIEKALNNNDIIVITVIKTTEEICKINDFCRKNKKGFLYANSFGLTGFIFSDFGEHIVSDEDGETNQKLFISSIKENIIENKIEFTIVKDENDGIDNEKYVIFKEIEGMEKLNHLEPTKIYKLDTNRYYINYNQSLGTNYIKGGIIEEVKKPMKIKYRSYRDYMKTPNNIVELDGSKKDRNCLIHCFILSIQKFYDKHKKIPEINNRKESEEILIFSNEFYLNFKNEGNELFKKSKSFDKNFIQKLSMIIECQIPSDISFLGGILAQEILKFSGLYKPLNQAFYYNNFITIENSGKNNVGTLYEKDRYYYENIVYGDYIINKLKSLNIFIIGAGALGCEIMKLLALMGASTNKNSNIIITDNDSIELSNLNRQFFFKKQHIGKNKASICCEEVKKINKDLNCIALDKLVNHNSENFFIDEFWSNLDIVILAVDNTTARRFIDKKCTAYNIKLIEIGTQGVNASSSIIVPHITSCYNDLKISNKKEIPQCTLKYYPLTIVHCIEYAKQKFDDFFHYNIKDALQFSKLNFDLLNEESKENFQKLMNIKYILKILINRSFEDCLNLAINDFYYFFNYNIRDLLNDFPPDFKKKDGTFFWNGDKRMPKEINFDVNDENQVNFIYYYAYLLAKNLKIDSKDKKYSKKYISENLIETKKILTTYEVKEQIQNIMEENQKEFGSLNLDEFKNFVYDEFEKDDDTNHHIDFLTAFSNLRPKNYGIEKCDRNIVKFIAGKIIPAISTTTASACGFMMSQIYVLIRKDFTIQDLRKINFSLSTPFFNIAKPSKPLIISNKIDKETKIEIKVPFDFNIWDKIEIKGSLTVKQLTNELIKKYGFSFDFDGLYTIHEVSIIKDDNDYEKLIEDLYFSNILKESKINNDLINKMGINKNDIFNNIYIKYYGSIDDRITILFPTIKYTYKKNINNN